jgi:hypothetical protein
MSSTGKFDRPGKEDRIAVYLAHPIDCMHPLRQVMVVLPVTVPFPLLVIWLGNLSLGEGFSNPQPSSCWMQLTFLPGKAADPPGPGVIATVPAKGMMHLIYKPQGQFPVAGVVSLPEKFEIVANSERIRPQVAFRAGACRIKSCQPGIVLHEVMNQRNVSRTIHYFCKYHSTEIKISSLITN